MTNCEECWWHKKPIECPADFDIDTKVCANFKAKGMTDNDIIKAIEFCSADKIVYCEDCPFNEKCLNDENLFKPALDLINRQKTEIDRLEKLNADLVELADRRKKSAFHSLREIIALRKSLQTAKADAIKEFADRLKTEIFNTEYHVDRFYRRSIDKIAKEMVGAE